MGYCKDIYRFACSIEYELKWEGNYGAKGEKRAKKKKPTPAQIKKQNQWNREKFMRRKIKLNFAPPDLWCTLKYRKGVRKPLEEVQKDIDSLIRKLRYRYQKKEKPLKWVIRIEVGKRGGIHAHILINRIEGTDIYLQECWPHGEVNYKSIYREGGYKKLAEYIVKEPEDESYQQQLSLFSEEEQKVLKKYSCSRNLLKPEPERHPYKNRTLRPLMENGIKPTKGYYIAPDSIHFGINPFTGMSYLHYTENKAETREERQVMDVPLKIPWKLTEEIP